MVTVGDEVRVQELATAALPCLALAHFLTCSVTFSHTNPPIHSFTQFLSHHSAQRHVLNPWKLWSGVSALPPYKNTANRTTYEGGEGRVRVWGLRVKGGAIGLVLRRGLGQGEQYG